MTSPREQKLKREVLQIVKAPYPESVWLALKRRGWVDQADKEEGYTVEDLIADAKEIAEDQRDTLREASGAEATRGDEHGRTVRFSAEGEPGPYELERCLAESLYLAWEIARSNPKVRSFRTRVLGGKLLTPDQAGRLVASPAAALLSFETFGLRSIPLLDHEVEIVDELREQRRLATTLVVSPPGCKVTARSRRHGLDYADENGDVSTVTVSRSSVLGELLEASQELVRRCPLHDLWPQADAARFILTGQAPRSSPLVGNVRIGMTGVIRLAISPYASAEAVRRFYLYVQNEAGETGDRRRQETATGAEVLGFVLEHTSAGDREPRWPELQSLWNAAHPDRPYTDRGALGKAYRRAYKRIIEPLLEA